MGCVNVGDIFSGVRIISGNFATKFSIEWFSGGGIGITADFSGEEVVGTIRGSGGFSRSSCIANVREKRTVGGSGSGRAEGIFGDGAKIS